MTIRHLTVFKAVCEEESITRAAKRLFMTQPAVSHVIADLEDRAGAPLFDRASRRLRLNQMGRQLYEKSCRVLEAYEELEKSMENLEQRTALRVGSSITIANFWLPGIISRFSKHAPDVPVEVTVDSAWRTSQRLEANEIDIAFIEGASYQEKFDSISFSSYQVIPLCAPDYFKERLFHRGERGESGWTLPPRALSAFRGAPAASRKRKRDPRRFRRSHDPAGFEALRFMGERKFADAASCGGGGAGNYVSAGQTGRGMAGKRPPDHIFSEGNFSEK